MLIHAICVHSDVTSGHDPDCYYCMFSYIAIFMPGYTKTFANVNKLSSRYTIDNLCAFRRNIRTRSRLLLLYVYYIAIFMRGYTQAIANVNKLSLRYTIDNLFAFRRQKSGHDPDCYNCMFSYIFFKHS